MLLKELVQINGSAPKAATEAYDAWDEADVWYRVSDGKLNQKSFRHAQSSDAKRQGWKQSHEEALKAAGIYPSKFKKGKFIQKNSEGKWIEVDPYS